METKGSESVSHRLAGQDEATLSPDYDASNSDPLDQERIVKHIMVIGFHHKHGYQVDYCYPPLKADGPVFSTPSNPISLPPSWKTLPLLCLPDGSHNFDSDTIYFTMPDVSYHTNENLESTEQATNTSNGIKTIFGTACYRQIQANKLLNRTEDMTRVAVQKSVCVLSTKPLFGLIRSKLEMITHAYFEELDFSKVKILKLTYDNLNSLLSRPSVKENGTFLGLSARHLVAQFGCNVLVLFKAMLLERKILFYRSPVRDLCSTIMSMCSLFTGLLECNGLDYSTCDLQLSSTLLETLKLVSPTNLGDDSTCDDDAKEPKEDKVFYSPSKEEVVIIKEDANISDSFQQIDLTSSFKTTIDDEAALEKAKSSSLSQTTLDEGANKSLANVEDHRESEDEDSFLADGSMVDDPIALRLCRQHPENCGLPLQIFTKGSFCLPYLSISYLDLLSDKRVRSYVIGATNFLFKQRKEMYDIVVDMEENTIIINDANLKKQLTLTTEDLRFMDFLSKQVKLENNQPKDEFDLISHDITKWVGGDEWIRYHFRLYTLYLLRVSKSHYTNFEPYNSGFVQAWKQNTNNYKVWESTGKISVLENLQARHPFSTGTKNLNFSDMKLKLSYAVNSSEKGRMINQTLHGIGRWSIWNNIASAATTAATSSAAFAASVAASTAATISQQTTSDNIASSDLKQERLPTQSSAEQRR